MLELECEFVEKFVFCGEIVRGRGVAAKQIATCKDEIKVKTGYDMVAGSLNVLLNRAVLFSNENAIQFDDGKRLLWPATMNNESVYLYRWKHAPLHVVEVLSDKLLRRSLKLHDGDLVEIEVQLCDIREINAAGKITWFLCWFGRRNWCYTNDEYYFRTINWCREFGATQEGSEKTITDLLKRLVWSKSMLKLIFSTSKSLIKRTPVVGNWAVKLNNAVNSRELSKIKSVPYKFERIPLNEASNSDDETFRKIRNVLNYTKLSGKSYSAQNFSAGYHSLNICGRRLEGQRDPTKRIESIPIDFHRKTVLDIGCNQGGMLHELSSKIEWGAGLDFDPRMVNAANRVKAVRKENNLDFFVFDVETEPLALIHDFLPGPSVDVVFLLAVCMWLNNWQDVFDFAAQISEAMVFESNGTEEQQAAQKRHLDSLYENITLLNDISDDDVGQKKRKLFLCISKS